MIEASKENSVEALRKRLHELIEQDADYSDIYKASVDLDDLLEKVTKHYKKIY